MSKGGSLLERVAAAAEERHLLENKLTAFRRMWVNSSRRRGRKAWSLETTGKFSYSVIMLGSGKTYLPAAGRDWLLPLYDPLVKLLGGDTARRILLDQAKVRPGHRVLDIGCGTGTLAVLIKRIHPGVDVVGLDPDPKALARAKRKAERSAVSIRLDQGFSDLLPYPQASFDRVFSTFMFHHLMLDQREQTLSEVRRILTPGGSLHMLDFTGSQASDYGPFKELGFQRWRHIRTALARHFHSSHRLKDNSEERILTLMNRAGFTSCKKVMNAAMLFGSLRIAYYQASAPMAG